LEKLRRLLETVRVVIPRNAKRGIALKAIDEGVSTKVNVNVGTSKDYLNLEDEVEKAKIAVKYGADAIMDPSTGNSGSSSSLDETRRAILKEVDVPVGTVPIYQAGLEKAEELAVVDMSADDMFNAVRKHAKDGIDFVTIHAGVNLNSLERLRKNERILDVASRGGTFLVAWMIHNERENPFYDEYDYLLEIANEYELTLSLGDGMRPGCISDASDRSKYMETIVLGELVKRAREEGVQAMVEGPGHATPGAMQAISLTK